MCRARHVPARQGMTSLRYAYRHNANRRGGKHYEQERIRFQLRRPRPARKTLSDYQGKVLLVVNTASKCGFTPQFDGLEELYEKYKDEGLEMLGFPCNQFGKQDPGSNDEITEFCQLNYGVSFPMFGKVEVNGSDADPSVQAPEERRRPAPWAQNPSSGTSPSS